ncbi:hypothetical protein B0H19DRAFT_1262581 [Mycena capillaripes]|nr:hypothetical protein B0H19DRAFT_1262581 [Mycena capillaripes]
MSSLLCVRPTILFAPLGIGVLASCTSSSPSPVPSLTCSDCAKGEEARPRHDVPTLRNVFAPLSILRMWCIVGTFPSLGAPSPHTLPRAKCEDPTLDNVLVVRCPPRENFRPGDHTAFDALRASHMDLPRCPAVSCTPFPTCSGRVEVEDASPSSAMAIQCLPRCRESEDGRSTGGL